MLERTTVWTVREPPIRLPHSRKQPPNGCLGGDGQQEVHSFEQPFLTVSDSTSLTPLHICKQKHLSPCRSRIGEDPSFGIRALRHHRHWGQRENLNDLQKTTKQPTALGFNLLQGTWSAEILQKEIGG